MYNAKSQFLNNKSYSSNVLQIITHYFSKKKQYCLFLDIDGTLSEFHVDPTKSFIPKNTLQTLQQLKDLNIHVIAITGRSVKVASQLFSPLQLPIAGTHGLEIQIDQQEKLNTGINELNISLLQHHVQKACLPYPQLLIENKDYSVALHYRQCPELAEATRKIAQDIQYLHPELKINEGKYVFELLPLEADKGQAIQKILQHYNFSNVLPIFIGDDKTDEAGFKVVNDYNGVSIKVGEEETEASYHLKNVEDVANFLDLFSQFLKTHFSGQSQVSNGEKACLN
ncbi:trehalose-phosphatase [Acinetobacter sp. ANC 4779]|uniref:trehalose-phosphatase n=1 Tax=Acinetobacter sp. ANC 4779 TaxID=2529848 RepID=UPI00103B7012|nr:trehalose-phosphatase [Acinetobacter sp. ANC 4779]TCB50749.1 trehalose-phosphatase [Acinetobacter sp. ANC 4779]